MPAFLTPQNLPPASTLASNSQTVASLPGGKNPTNSSALDKGSGSFSALYNESVGDTDLGENVTSATSNGDNQPARITPVNVSGKPADQAASGLLQNGNYLPGNAVNPNSSPDASVLQQTSSSGIKGPITAVGQNLAIMASSGNAVSANNKGISPENVVNGSKEASDSPSKLPIVSATQMQNSNLALNDFKSSAVRVKTYAGLQENEGTGKQQSGVLSQSTGGQAAILSTIETDNQILPKPIKDPVSLENTNLGVSYSLPIKALTRSQASGNLENRASSIKTITNQLPATESDTGLNISKLKPVVLDTAKEVISPIWNQTLRPSTLQNMESANTFNKDIGTIISAQASGLASEAKQSMGEESGNQSLRTLAAIPNIGFSQSNLMISATPSTSILTSNVSSPAWSAEFSQQIVIFSQKGFQQANLQLNPQHLGPMEVRISMGNDQQVNLSFNTQHGMVKDAIDIALPRLREMFEQQGLNLGNVNVSNHSEQNARQQKFNNNTPLPTSDVDSSVDEVSEEKTLLIANAKSNYLVDYYA